MSVPDLLTIEETARVLRIGGREGRSLRAPQSDVIVALGESASVPGRMKSLTSGGQPPVGLV